MIKVVDVWAKGEVFSFIPVPATSSFCCPVQKFIKQLFDDISQKLHGCNEK